MNNPIIKLRCICGYDIPALRHDGGDYYCPQCKGRARIVESTTGTRVELSRYLKSAEEYDGEMIRAEVEAMDWPDKIET